MEVLSEISFMESLEEEREDEGDEAKEEDKQSMLKLFFMEIEDEAAAEEEISSCTPKSLNSPTRVAL